MDLSFFSYRLDALKRARWESPGLSKYPPTIAGFIEHSTELFDVVDNPESSNTKMAYDMTDSAHNTRRMGNFAGNHQYVAFRHSPDEPFLLSSIYQVKDISLIGAMVNKLSNTWSPEKESNYINQLVSMPTSKRIR